MENCSRLVRRLALPSLRKPRNLKLTTLAAAAKRRIESSSRAFSGRAGTRWGSTPQAVALTPERNALRRYPHSFQWIVFRHPCSKNLRNQQRNLGQAFFKRDVRRSEKVQFGLRHVSQVAPCTGLGKRLISPPRDAQGGAVMIVKRSLPFRILPHVTCVAPLTEHERLRSRRRPRRLTVSPPETTLCADRPGGRGTSRAFRGGTRSSPAPRPASHGR